MRLADDRAPGFGGPAIRLGQQIADLIDQERQLAGVIGQTGGVLDDERHSVPVNRPSPRLCTIDATSARAALLRPASGRDHPRNQRAP